MIDHRLARSIIFVHSSLDDAGLTANEFRVYCHLARRSGHAGDAFPSAQTISEVCRMHRDTVWEALRTLQSRGMVQRAPRPGLSTLYVLTTPDQWVISTNPPETKGRPSEPPTGNEGPPPSGIQGPPPTGNKGPRRESTEGNPPKGIQRRANAPTLDEWTAYCTTTWPDWHPDCAGESHAYYAMAGWRTRAGAIRDWKAAARTAHANAVNWGKLQPKAETLAPPTLEEWFAEGARLNRAAIRGTPEWSAEAAEAIWYENDAKGWRFVTNWKSAILAAYNRFLGNEQQFANRRSR